VVAGYAGSGFEVDTGAGFTTEVSVTVFVLAGSDGLTVLDA
jgi:hypothetical protein